MHRRSIPSPAPFFFPTTTTLKAYGLLNSSITPFLSIISICSSIHLCSFGVWYPIFPTTGTSLTSLIACSTLVQFPISCVPFDTISSYSSRIFCTSSGYVSVISYKRQSLSSSRCSMSCIGSHCHVWVKYVAGFPSTSTEGTSLTFMSSMASSHSSTASSVDQFSSLKLVTRFNQFAACSDNTDSLSESLPIEIISVSSSSLYQFIIGPFAGVLTIFT